MSEALLFIGKKIEKERLAKRISKSKIASDLKLANKYLEQIEDGTLDDNLQMNNVIRYLNIYLRYFDLDEKALVKNYQNSLEGNTENKKKKQKQDSDQITFPWSNIINLSILLIALLFILANFIDKRELKQHLKNLPFDTKVLLRN